MILTFPSIIVSKESGKDRDLDTDLQVIHCV